jgi:hypothetical protein
MKTGNRIDAYKGFSHITRIRQELQEQDSGKNLRTQESWLTRQFLPCQLRFGLHGSCQKVKIRFFRQESFIEGIEKECYLKSKKNKNLERTMTRSSICAVTMGSARLIPAML